MKTALSIAPAAALIAALGAGPAFAGHHEEHGMDRADGHATMLMAGLLGSNEVSAGDEDGRGQFMAWPDGDGQLCYRLMVTNIETATMAHIHTGAAGVNGPVAVSLEAPADGKVEACTAVAEEMMAEIWAAPGDYYVNVHNADFPGGAVRGQLMDHGK